MRWIEIIKIEPYFRNPRKNDKAIEPVKQSITKFGFLVPIVLDKKNVIICGHTRYKAVLELKGTLDKIIEELKDAPNLKKNLEMINQGKIAYEYAEDLSEKQIKEYRIVDNRTNQLSEWDNERLKFELRELNQVIGFTDEDIKRLSELDIRFETYTNEEINDIKNETEEHISHRDTDLVEIICPACNNVFFISKGEIDKKY